MACGRLLSDTLSETYDTGAVASIVDPNAHAPQVAMTWLISVQYGRVNMEVDKNVHPMSIPVTFPILSITAATAGLPRTCTKLMPM